MVRVYTASKFRLPQVCLDRAFSYVILSSESSFSILNSQFPILNSISGLASGRRTRARRPAAGRPPLRHVTPRVRDRPRLQTAPDACRLAPGPLRRHGEPAPASREEKGHGSACRVLAGPPSAAPPILVHRQAMRLQVGSRAPRGARAPDRGSSFPASGTAAPSRPGWLVRRKGGRRWGLAYVAQRREGRRGRGGRRIQALRAAPRCGVPTRGGSREADPRPALPRQSGDRSRVARAHCRDTKVRRRPPVPQSEAPLTRMDAGCSAPGFDRPRARPPSFGPGMSRSRRPVERPLQPCSGPSPKDRASRPLRAESRLAEVPWSG